MSDHMLIGSVVATVLVVVVTVQIAMDTAYWTVFNHITVWGSLIWYFLLQYFYNYVIGGPYVGALSKVGPIFLLSSPIDLPLYYLSFHILSSYPPLPPPPPCAIRATFISPNSSIMIVCLAAYLFPSPLASPLTSLLASLLASFCLS